jgi:hypothetical protein
MNQAAPCRTTAGINNAAAVWRYQSGWVGTDIRSTGETGLKTYLMFNF